MCTVTKGPGGDGVADCQDDCQRRCSPVKPRQPRQGHQGTQPHSAVSFLRACGITAGSLKCLFLSVCSYDPTEEPKDCHSLQILAKPVINSTQSSHCNELHYSEKEQGILSLLQPPGVHVRVCVRVAESLDEWLFTLGLIENLKYIIVPLFLLHNTIKVHVLRVKQSASDWRKETFGMIPGEAAACQSTLSLLSYLGPAEDATIATFCSLLDDTCPRFL